MLDVCACLAAYTKAINFRIRIPIFESWSALVVHSKRLSAVFFLTQKAQTQTSFTTCRFQPCVFSSQFLCLNDFRKCTYAGTLLLEFL